MFLLGYTRRSKFSTAVLQPVVGMVLGMVVGEHSGTPYTAVLALVDLNL